MTGGETFWVLTAAAVGLDIYAIGRALTRGHGVESTLAWIFAILLLPVAGSVAYLSLASPGIRRTARRKRERAQAIAGDEPDTSAPGSADVVPRDHPAWPVMRLASRLTGLDPTAGNAVELLVENVGAAERIGGDLRSARTSIWAEWYMIRNDGTGKAFLQILEERARQGVAVYLVYDAVGSLGLDARRLEALRAAGARVAAFLPVNPLRRRWSLHLRNHRKLVVIDGRVGYTGGMNVGDEYSGRPIGRLRKAVRGRPSDPADAEHEAVWRDTHLRVEGPAVADLGRIFAEDWAFAAEEELALPATPGRAPGGDATVGIVPSGPDQLHNANGLAYFTGITTARRRVWITSAYFVPDQPTLRALISAALRGIDVRLLVPAKSDVVLVTAAARSYFPALVAGGVRIFEYLPSVLHAKTMVVDGAWGMVGSANVDVRSFRLNFELGALVFGGDAMQQLEQRFVSDLEDAREVTPLRLVEYGTLARLRDGLARLASPLL